jgi:hypothetical protein
MDVLKVAVADWLLAKRVFDPARDRVADPDDGSDEDDGKGELKRVDHEGLLIPL